MSEIKVINGDITKLEVGAIVNAANKTLLGGGGVDGAIHYVAGPELLEECRRLNGCDVGEAKITKGYKLKAGYIIHTVGPKYTGSDEDEKLLRSCYRNSLNLAKTYNIHSIAFPGISTGKYRYPKYEATQAAVDEIRKWFRDNAEYDITVCLTCINSQVEDIYRNVIKQDGGAKK